MSLFITPENGRRNRNNKYSGEERNPCKKENELSLKCLDANGYNRDACLNFFENYKLCKAFWLFVYKERKRKNIQPYLPVPEEREAVKQEYMPYFKGY